jgi:uncharacterized membrane-anchored protein
LLPTSIGSGDDRTRRGKDKSPYILTRPLGASLGDLLSQARDYGGFGLGTVYTSLGFLVVIIGLVIFISTGANGVRSQAVTKETA